MTVSQSFNPEFKELQEQIDYLEKQVEDLNSELLGLKNTISKLELILSCEEKAKKV